ncbi:MAG: class I SAM-dependent methyltransferase [Deltaproteobacteria bacterium]
MTYNNNYYKAFENNTVNLPYEKLNRMFKMVRYEFDCKSLAVLDAGCGTGLVCKYLKEKGIKDITGIDNFEYPLSRAKELVTECNFIKADLNEQLELPDGSFDLIISNEVIEHLEHPEIFFEESRRILKTGGSLILKTPNGLDINRFICKLTNRVWYADKDKTHIQYFNALSLKNALASCGFKDIIIRTGTKPLLSIKGIKIPPFPFVGNGVVARGIK